jgi:ribonuclease III
MTRKTTWRNNNMIKKNFHDFEKKIDSNFKDKNLLSQAFTHRSYLNENRHSSFHHNERLEFLGDAVLELVVTDYLFKEYSDHMEGDLTSFRSALVNTNTLSETATKIGMNDYLLLSKGEAKDTGRARQYILADTYEALIGALYIDGGYDVASKFITETLLPQMDEIMKNQLWQDSKSRFQEIAQEKVSVTPTYKTLEESGPDHNKHFIVGVFLNDDLVSRGEGKSKQEAEQAAAEEGLKAKGW